MSGQGIRLPKNKMETQEALLGEDTDRCRNRDKRESRSKCSRCGRLPMLHRWDP